MNNGKNLIRSLFIVLFGALSSKIVLAAPPKFLEIGKIYTVTGLAGSQAVKLLELDRDSGWARVQVEKPRAESYWLNLNQVVIIKEGGPPTEKTLPPPRF